MVLHKNLNQFKYDSNDSLIWKYNSYHSNSITPFVNNISSQISTVINTDDPSILSHSDQSLYDNIINYD